MKAKPRMLAPSECNTEARLMDLPSTLSETEKSWVLVDEKGVLITNHIVGLNPTGSVRLSLADMRKFARWFLRKQRCK